ncbi:cytochrome c oxidase assembly protein CtaG [Brucella abortus NI593]|nr:cytochrome c oxidase assembly protein CtaG [Brucella abortus bv. 1 str. NI435a]EHR12914.1 cytochrome c oxidase assembly protein CtaG [Brucella abortus bv. 1 str. NI486]EHR24215.1 cytochrome c oxidase assembly protein CtaG [Brucella abortus bv. 1 str. NI488]EHR29320.1 cytochrome c oxidase assembly protein CtaG [Brucella abortus bv. 1 str. NI021]ENQ14764.1 cytochrome c oxidase assembly protein CtaG [Brucella abortus NI240]ENQ16880.1 cytochrome c oxidase assembly protein CtaG [Brucella abortus
MSRRAGAYFNKVECFCFTDNTLKPGEDLELPVVFFVDPEFVNDPDLKDVKTITLSLLSSRLISRSRW